MHWMFGAKTSASGQFSSKLYCSSDGDLLVRVKPAQTRDCFNINTIGIIISNISSTRELINDDLTNFSSTFSMKGARMNIQFSDFSHIGIIDNRL